MSDVESPTTSYGTHVERLRERVNDALSTLVEVRQPEDLYEPARYVLAGRGKRLRPLLVLLTGRTFGAAVDELMPAALAVEVFHNFTLVHDDIMDHADSRRGRPTVHVRWDEPTAILCGDYLMALAYRKLARTPGDRLADVLDVFDEMVERLCEGQSLDKSFETRAAVPVDDYLDMIDRKTGALLRACFELGGLVGHADAAARATLREIGRDVGRAFQIQDDLLDLTADSARWGKTIGGDLIEGKKTFLLLRALERARDDDARWFERIVENGGLAPENVPEARERMDHLGVLDDASTAVARYTDAAHRRLDALPVAPARETLHDLLRQMGRRAH